MQYSNKQVEMKRTVEQDKSFPGRNIDQMPLLLGEGRSPWTAVRFMKERIAHANEFPDLLSNLSVSDLIVYDSSETPRGKTLEYNDKIIHMLKRGLFLLPCNFLNFAVFKPVNCLCVFLGEMWVVSYHNDCFAFFV